MSNHDQFVLGNGGGAPVSRVSPYTGDGGSRRAENGGIMNGPYWSDSFVIAISFFRQNTRGVTAFPIRANAAATMPMSPIPQ